MDDPRADAAVRLRSVQDRFLAALREGREDLTEGGAAVFLDPPRGTAGSRWRIYLNGYVARLVDAIENDYPATKRILGPSVFRALGARYVAACPPSSHDIARAGARLPEYLPRDPVTERLPFLPDLARFERALAEAVVAADAEPVSRDALAALDPEELLDLVIAPRPGSSIVRSEWPLGDLWNCRDKEDGEISVEVVDRPSILAIYRDGLAVRFRVASDEEARFVERVVGGASLAEVVDSGAFGPVDESVPRLVSLFLALIESSIVLVRFPETPQSVSE